MSNYLKVQEIKKNIEDEEFPLSTILMKLNSLTKENGKEIKWVKDEIMGYEIGGSPDLVPKYRLLPADVIIPEPGEENTYYFFTRKEDVEHAMGPIGQSISTLEESIKASDDGFLYSGYQDLTFSKNGSRDIRNIPIRARMRFGIDQIKSILKTVRSKCYEELDNIPTLDQDIRGGESNINRSLQGLTQNISFHGPVNVGQQSFTGDIVGSNSTINSYNNSDEMINNVLREVREQVKQNSSIISSSQKEMVEGAMSLVINAREKKMLSKGILSGLSTTLLKASLPGLAGKVLEMSDKIFPVEI